ncbi:MAG: amidohydrolase [Pirellulales bacterium]
MAASSDTWKTKIDAAVEHRYDDLVAVRRHLHAHPEISGEEHETSLYLYQMLSDAGFDVQMGPDGRGLIVESRRNAEGPLLALRADIDALRIQDEKLVPYRSQKDGVMHACGHDAHTAILVGALTALKELEANGDLPWPVNVRGIFQPAEETSTGAAELVAAGVLDKVDAILALHVDPSRTVGRIGIRTGILTANCDVMRLTIVGRGGHAARPHEAIDPIATAAQLISCIYLSIPRATDSQDAVVVTIGCVQGGSNPNVIPEQVELHGTLRTLDDGVRDRAMQHIEQICRGIAESSGTKIQVAFEARIGAVCNDRHLADLIRQVAGESLGQDHVEEIQRPSMGSEDFAVYLQHVPGAMLRLGCAKSGSNGTPLHNASFDLDEAAIGIGSKLIAHAAINWSAAGQIPPEKASR